MISNLGLIPATGDQLQRTHSEGEAKRQTSPCDLLWEMLFLVKNGLYSEHLNKAIIIVPQ